MIHGSDRFTHPFNRWMMGYTAFERVTTAYEARGYVTTHALRAYYPATKRGKWVIVQELQNEHTLTCFWLCYLAGSRGGVYERTPGGHRTVSPQRNDLTLHAVPGDGLYFWPALREAGYDDATIDGMRDERYAFYLD